MLTPCCYLSTKTMRVAGGTLTAALVADGAVGYGAALGDGHGDGRLDAGLPRGVGQHDGAQALGASPDGAHLRAAARRHRGARVLRGRRARGKLERHLVHRDAAALPRTVRRLQPGEAGHQEHRDDAEAPRLELHFLMPGSALHLTLCCCLHCTTLDSEGSDEVMASSASRRWLYIQSRGLERGREPSWFA